MKRIILDSKSNRYFDENGYLVIKDNKIAKAGVFDYLGKEISKDLEENEIYKVYRDWEELEKSAKDFEGIPVKLGHEWVEIDNKDKKVGNISGEVKLQEPYLIADIKIYDKEAINAITTKNIVELSPGYTAKYIEKTGEYHGETYSFKQEDIKYNHLAIVENGRSGKEVKINDENSIKKGEINMSTNLRRNALQALSLAQKCYDENPNNKQDIVREIVALAVKSDNEFAGGETEKFETILKKAQELGFEDTAVSDNNQEEVKSSDRDVATMKEAFETFAKLFSAFLNEEQKEEVHDREAETNDENDNEKKSNAKVEDSSQVMDAKIAAAINAERKRTQDAVAAYQEVMNFVGHFNMAGMNEAEIYQYAYNVLAGEKVKTNDAKASFNAFIKASRNNIKKSFDNSISNESVANNLSNFVK